MKFIGVFLSVWLLYAESAGQEKPTVFAGPVEVLRHFGEMPRVLTIPNGVLIALFISHDGPGVPAAKDDQQVRARYSTDNGDSWGQEKVLFTLPKEAGGFGYWVGMVDGEGEIHLFLLNDRGSGAILPLPEGKKGPSITIHTPLDIWHVRSVGSRKEWEVPKRIWAGRAGDLQSVIQLRSGRIVLPFSYLTDRTWGNRGSGPERFTYYGQFNCGVLYSDDGGDTWVASPDTLKTTAVDLSAYGPIEPVVVERNDGRVWMLIRTQMGRFYESFSDDGSRWSRPEPSGLLSSDAPAGLLRLQSGELLLLLNSCQRFPYGDGGRHVLHAAISGDDGKTWAGFREVLRDPQQTNGPPPTGDNGVSYPYLTLAPDGRVVFSLWVDGTASGRNLYRLDPHWLRGTDQNERFDNRLDSWSVFGTKGVVLVRHPQNPARQVLSIRKDDLNWSSGAVWNFPAGTQGKLTMKLLLREGFGGIRIGLTDHFSVPFDELAIFHNLINVEIGNDGRIADLGAPLVPGRWYDLSLSWDCTQGLCEIAVDKATIGRLKLSRQAEFANYLRLQAMSKDPDQGLLISEIQIMNRN